MHNDGKHSDEYNNNRGKLILIPGPVGARKTKLLKKQMLGHAARGEEVLLVIFGEDFAYQKWFNSHRDRQNIQLLIVRSAAELIGDLSRLRIPPIIGFDNAHLCGDELISICRRLAWGGSNIYIAGQSQDYLRRPSSTMAGLMAFADELWPPLPEPRCYECGNSNAPYIQMVGTQLNLEGKHESVDWSIADPSTVMALPCCRPHFIHSAEDALSERFHALGLEEPRDPAPRGRSGSIEVVTGPMYSGKTYTAIGVAEYANHVGRELKVFVHKDEARKESKLTSHSGSQWEPAYRVSNSTDLWEILIETGFPELIIIDEAQFFDDGLVPVSGKLADIGCDVLISGLNLYWFEEPFGPVPELMALADRVRLLTAMCSFSVSCDEPATRTIRIKGDGLPAAYRELPAKEAGDMRKGYEPRCRQHHYIPNHPVYTNIKINLA
jgi:thymidine kinase